MSTTHQTFDQTLRRHTKIGELYDVLPDGTLRCFACGHLCAIKEGRSGICKVRFSEHGKLHVPSGYVGALQCDPIEKKPFFHALPGSDAFSFGMLGCDFHCSYCQNWITSQAIRDPRAVSPLQETTVASMIAAARRAGALTVASTYNEPLITSEWAVEVFKRAKKEGLRTAYISNGNATPRVLDYLRPWLDLYKVDLKGFDDRRYRELGGVLDNVLRSIRDIHERGFWLEVVTLVVPGFNDSDDELQKIADFLSNISPDVPWHVTAFHKDYRMKDPDHTSIDTLLRAARIGEKAGLRYVYAGNLPGLAGSYEHTRCPRCKKVLIERYGFTVLANRMADGCCPSCKTKIPGVWN